MLNQKAATLGSTALQPLCRADAVSTEDLVSAEKRLRSREKRPLNDAHFYALLMSDDLLSPPLKWAGGKRWLVPRLRPLLERYPERRLVEPFAGGLSVTFGLRPSGALVNDINPHVINFYRHLQEGLNIREVLLAGLDTALTRKWRAQSEGVFAAEQQRRTVKSVRDHSRSLPYANEAEITTDIAVQQADSQHRQAVHTPGEWENDKPFFYAAREHFNYLISTGERETREAASLFYYLNRTAFNGLCRFNASGQFNVPYGRYASIGYRYHFPEHRAALRPWRLQNGDFTELVVDDESDWLYVDPPYDVAFTGYAEEGFRWRDQERLLNWLSLFSCPVILSNQATERIIALYHAADYRVYRIPVRRKINSAGDKRGPVDEVLAFRGLDEALLPTDLIECGRPSSSRG